jgi:probable HAF family extracellular repeat protein
MTAVLRHTKSLRVRALVRRAIGTLTLLACASAGAQVVTMKYVVNNLGNLTGVDGSSVQALALNEAGQVVGQSIDADGKTHAFRTAPNRAIKALDDLGTLSGNFSAAAGINYRYPYDSQVVGAASTTNDAAFHAFLWTGKVFNGGTMVDLNTRIVAGSGWELVGAKGINNKCQYELSAGQINALTDKLNNAYNSIRAGLFKQAVNNLDAASKAVQTQLQVAKMSPATANALRAAIDTIRVTLQ